MKKALLLVSILFISVISTACINNFAVQELNSKAKESMEKGDYQTAIERLKSSIDLDSTVFETHYNLAVAYTKAEDYQKAITAYDEASKLNPDFNDTYYSLAVCQENLAKDLLSRSVKLDENNEIVKNNSSEDDEKDDENKSNELSDTEKTFVIQLLDSAVKNYTTYISNDVSAAEKAEVENSITELNNKINELNGTAVTEPKVISVE